MITLLQATPEMAVEMTQITESMSFGDLFMAGGWLSTMKYQRSSMNTK